LVSLGAGEPVRRVHADGERAEFVEDLQGVFRALLQLL